MAERTRDAVVSRGLYTLGVVLYTLAGVLFLFALFELLRG